MTREVVYSVLIGFAGTAFGSTTMVETECIRSGLRRKVEVVSEDDETKSGCKVVYQKKDEGLNRKELWQSQYEPSFCQERAKELVAQLKDWGWTCKDQATK